MLPECTPDRLGLGPSGDDVPSGADVNPPDPAGVRVGYVTKMFPRFSETFVLTELLQLERLGYEVEIFSLRPPADGRFHANLRATHRGGTMANLGLQMGWATISPRWRGLWGSATLPQNYATVMKTEGAKFNALFHGLLDRGVYIAPALYEAGFVSAAHTADDIAATVAAAREVFASLR